jgi:hypothetical protein
MRRLYPLFSFRCISPALSSSRARRAHQSVRAGRPGDTTPESPESLAATPRPTRGNPAEKEIVDSVAADPREKARLPHTDLRSAWESIRAQVRSMRVRACVRACKTADQAALHGVGGAVGDPDPKGGAARQAHEGVKPLGGRPQPGQLPAGRPTHPPAHPPARPPAHSPTHPPIDHNWPFRGERERGNERWGVLRGEGRGRERWRGEEGRGT